MFYFVNEYYSHFLSGTQSFRISINFSLRKFLFQLCAFSKIKSPLAEPHLFSYCQSPCTICSSHLPGIQKLCDNYYIEITQKFTSEYAFRISFSLFQIPIFISNILFPQQKYIISKSFVFFSFIISTYLIFQLLCSDN